MIGFSLGKCQTYIIRVMSFSPNNRRALLLDISVVYFKNTILSTKNESLEVTCLQVRNLRIVFLFQRESFSQSPLRAAYCGLRLSHIWWCGGRHGPEKLLASHPRSAASQLTIFSSGRIYWKSPDFIFQSIPFPIRPRALRIVHFYDQY